MSLDKIKAGLSKPIKQENSESPFNRDQAGAYLLKRISPNIFPPIKVDAEQQNTKEKS